MYVLFCCFITANLTIILHYSVLKKIFDYPAIKLDYIDWFYKTSSSSQFCPKFTFSKYLQTSQKIMFHTKIKNVK